MPRIIKTTVYQFHELSDAAKENARAWFRESADDGDWYEFIYDDFEEICRILGIALKTYPVASWAAARGRSLASTSPASGRRATAPASRASIHMRRARPGASGTTRRRIANCMRSQAGSSKSSAPISSSSAPMRVIAATTATPAAWRFQSTRDSPGAQEMTDGAEDAVTESLRDLAHWLHRRLEREWEYLMSDAYADEGIAANAYTFTESGRRFG